MKFRRTSGVLIVIVGIALMTLILVPLLPYSVSLQIPFLYEGPPTCTSQTIQGVPVCYYTHLYPPKNIAGSASLSYTLFGIGLQPFNSSYRITVGNNSAIFYVTGTRVSSAELYQFPSFKLNPAGIIAIQNTSITRDALGLVSFSTTLENVGSQPLDKISALLDSVPGNGDNYTAGGITWVDGQEPGSPCAVVLMPLSSCNASFDLINQSVGAGRVFWYRIQAEGLSGGSGFVYQQWLQGVWPATGVTSNWVASFIQEVNANRTSTQLVENQTLNAFAKERFQTQVANFNISDYDFQQDYARSFPGSSVQVGEVILWPGADLPFEYASFLQQSAPGHWSVLTDPAYAQFGYYIGYGPTIIASQPCSITEFPGGVNMTALLASHGCQFHIEQATWLVIEVGT